MSNPREFVSINAVDPIITAIFLEPPAWTRLEPQSISGDPEPGLEARIHDPLWLLARQWQLAEFEGEDAGTPLIVQVKTQTLPVTAWQPGDPAGARPARAITPGTPLDPLIENEPPAAEIGLRQRAEAGAYLVELLDDAGLDARAALVAACPLPVEAGTEPVPPSFLVIATATPDGIAAATQLEAGAPPCPSGRAWLNCARDCAALGRTCAGSPAYLFSIQQTVRLPSPSQAPACANGRRYFRLELMGAAEGNTIKFHGSGNWRVSKAASYLEPDMACQGEAESCWQTAVSNRNFWFISDSAEGPPENITIEQRDLSCGVLGCACE